jgi:hypothetical protein
VQRNYLSHHAIHNVANLIFDSFIILNGPVMKIAHFLGPAAGEFCALGLLEQKLGVEFLSVHGNPVLSGYGIVGGPIVV